MDNDSFLNFWGSDWLTFAFIIFLITLFGLWRVFEKAGKPGWAVLIPFYNVIVILEIVGKPWWWLLLMIFIPPLSMIWIVWTLNLLSKSFGKGAGFTVGMYFLPFIFFPVLGYGPSEYLGPAGNNNPF